MQLILIAYMIVGAVVAGMNLALAAKQGNVRHASVLFVVSLALGVAWPLIAVVVVPLYILKGIKLLWEAL